MPLNIFGSNFLFLSTLAATFYFYPEGKCCLNIRMHTSLRGSLDLCPLYIIKYFYVFVH